MDNKAKQRKTILGLGFGFLILIACNLSKEAIPLIEKTSVPFIPGNPTATPLGSDINDSNFIKGVEAFYNGDYEETIILMNAVIEANPNLAPPYRYRGAALGLTGKCTAGLADAEKAISLEPDYAAAWAIRGLNNACLGNEEQKTKDYEKALSIDPSLAFVHHNLGVDYYQRGNYEKSLDEYSMAVVIDPTRSSAWAGMAEAQSKLGRYDECIQNTTKALNINQEEWLAYSDRGVCEQLIGENNEAITDFKIFLEHDPTDAIIWYDLGTTQHALNLPEEAINSFTRSLELDPSYYQANINRGWALIDVKKYDEALADFNKALEFGDIPAAYSGRGTVYYWLERYDKAIADLELAASAMPDRPHSFCMLAYTYFEVGRYQDSLDAATKVNQISPGCGGQHLITVQARDYYELGDYEQAILYMNRSMEVQEFTLGFYYRGKMYQAAGKEQKPSLTWKPS